MRSFYYEKYYKFVVNNDNIYLKGYEIKLGELEIVYSLAGTRKLLMGEMSYDNVYVFNR